MIRLVFALYLMLLISSCLQETDDCTFGVLTNNILHKHSKEWQVDSLIIKTNKSETITLSNGRVEILKNGDRLTLIEVYEIGDSAKHTIQFSTPCFSGNNNPPQTSSATSLINGDFYTGTGYISSSLFNDTRGFKISQTPNWWTDSTKLEVRDFYLKLKR